MPASADLENRSVSGGLIDIQAGLTAEASSDPFASATVEGGFVQAGETLVIRATHGNLAPPLSDGTITAINCNGADTLCFAANHGVATGDTVVYSAPALPDSDPLKPLVESGQLENPNRIPGLHDGRTYGVIETSDSTLKLGVEFNAGGSVDLGRAAITFGREHNLETGDSVVYDCNGGSPFGTNPAGGLVCGATYTVFKVDDRTLRLASGATGGAFSFTPSNVAGAVFTVPSTAALSDGQALVYHAPAALTFNAGMVDITVDIVDGEPRLHRSGDSIDHSSNSNFIFAPNRVALGFTNGAELIYTAAVTSTDPSPPATTLLSPLTSNGHYWVAITSEAHRIQLADSACHAGIGSFDADPGSGVDIQPCSAHVQTLALSPNFSADSLKTVHTLRRADRQPILTEGQMYFVDVLNGTQFRLLDRNGNAVTPSGTSGGTHRLVNEGIAITAAGSGTQRLVVDLGSGALTGSPHVLIGVGGPGGQLGQSDGIVSATATGIGGGLFRFSDVASNATSFATVKAEVLGGLLRGRDIEISTFSHSNVAVSSVGKGGGFLSFGASDANADVKNTVTTSVAGGATLAASRDIKILAGGSESANGESVNKTGGLIGTADTDVDAADRLPDQDRHRRRPDRQPHDPDRRRRWPEGLRLRGLELGRPGHELRRQRRGRQRHPDRADYTAIVESRIGTGASLRADNVQVSAGLGVEHDVDESDRRRHHVPTSRSPRPHAPTLTPPRSAPTPTPARTSSRTTRSPSSSRAAPRSRRRACDCARGTRTSTSRPTPTRAARCGGGDTDARAEVDYTARLARRRRRRRRHPDRRPAGRGATRVRHAVRARAHRPAASSTAATRTRDTGDDADADDRLGRDRLPARRAEPGADHRRRPARSSPRPYNVDVRAEPRRPALNSAT